MKPAIHSPDRRRLAKSIVVSLYFTLVLVAGSSVFGAPAAVPGRILVKPHPGIAEAQLHGLFRQHNAVQVDQISAINVRILKVPEAARDQVVVHPDHAAGL